MSEEGKANPPSETTLSAGSVPSCLRNRNGTTKKNILDRRVSFPENEHHIVTGFMEPANPWEYADFVNRDELTANYLTSCDKHKARALGTVLSLIQILNFDVERNESLNLKGETLGAAECETLEEILKRVQFVTVNLEGTGIDDEASVAMFDMIEYYESATNLIIAGNHSIGVRGWQACSRMIKRTKCLEELDARNTTLNEQYMPILSRALRLSSQLHVLKLENCNLSGRPILILTGALKLNTGLKELYLGENYLTPNDAMQLSGLLKVNSVLQLLDISNNNIQDSGLGHISDGLTDQSNSGSGLAVLILWNNNLTRKSSGHLARTLANSKTLETLNVGQNVLSNEVLHVTKDALQQNRTLLRLGMQSTHLTCEGAVALAEIIADNPVIQRIDLRDNNLQVAGLMALSLSMKVNTSVTQMDLDDTPRRKHSMGSGVGGELTRTGGVVRAEALGACLALWCWDSSKSSKVMHVRPSASDPEGPTLDEYVRLVGEIREYCKRNEANLMKKEEEPDVNDNKEEEEGSSETLQIPEKRSRLGSFASRKISLTCETLMRAAASPPPEPSQLLAEPKRSGGRLRSPAPSPIPSPVASPSPTRSRFQVSKVSESDSPVTPLSTSPPTIFFGSGSRFRVTVVDPAPVPVMAANNNVTIGFETPSLQPTSPSPSPSVTMSPSSFPVDSAKLDTSLDLSLNSGSVPAQTFTPVSTRIEVLSPPHSPVPSLSDTNIKENAENKIENTENKIENTENNFSPRIPPVSEMSLAKVNASSVEHDVSGNCVFLVKENIPVDREKSPLQEEMMSPDRDESPTQEEKLSPCRVKLLPQRDKLHTQEEKTPPQREKSPPQREKPPTEREMSPLQKEKSPPLKEKITIQREKTFPQDEETSSQEKSSLREESILAKGNNAPLRSVMRECVHPHDESKVRSDSEDSDREVLLSKSKLPKATDSLDLTAFRVTKQSSVSVSEKSHRMRKISWVQPSSVFSSPFSLSSSSSSQDETVKPPSSLERLLGLFHNPFSRQKNEVQPLPKVPEQSEKPPENCDISRPVSSQCEVTPRTVDCLVKNFSQTNISPIPSDNSKFQTNVDVLPDAVCKNDSSNIVDLQKPCVEEHKLSKKTTVESRTVTSEALSKTDENNVGSECKIKNIPDVLNNNSRLEVELGDGKCETWPQGRGAGSPKLSILNHQSQSSSAPSLTALVLLQGNVASDISVGIQKMSPTTSSETIDTAKKNISLAL